MDICIARAVSQRVESAVNGKGILHRTTVWGRRDVVVVDVVAVSLLLLLWLGFCRLLLTLLWLWLLAVDVVCRLPPHFRALEATAFLEQLDTERIIQLAMLADAAAEAIVITRLLDTEQCVSEDVSLKLEVFLSTIKMLFLDGGCKEHGYTAFALKNLQRSIVVFVGGRPKCIGCQGAAATATVESCMKRMQKWVKLCTDVIRSEFPNFGFLASFSVFHLPDAGECDGVPLELTDPVTVRLRRLANYAQVDPDELVSQYSEVYPGVHVKNIYTNRTSGMHSLTSPST